jgi:K+/H+ antiporter YhaU regulatory subunit KhtT
LGITNAHINLVNKKKSQYKVDESLSFKTIHKNLDEYQEAINLFEKQDNEKKEILSGMDKLVKSMLKTTMINQAI